jgi:hypothetical protein
MAIRPFISVEILILVLPVYQIVHVHSFVLKLDDLETLGGFPKEPFAYHSIVHSEQNTGHLMEI